MNDIGAYLKSQRQKLHLSLSEVHKLCGITDSKLSRFERGEGKAPSPSELKLIASVYGIDVVPLYILAGYLDESDLRAYQLVFHGAELLTIEERQSIQTQIELFVKGRMVAGNDI